MAYSLASPVESELLIRKSRFIGCVQPVADRAAAQEIVARLRQQHPGAAHVCWALLAGGHSAAVDDGEPGGTAGRPMLEVLRLQNLEGVLATVVRYFGGIKLGAGGAASSRSGRIAVLSTELTARSVRLASLVQRYAQDVVVDILPCPGWADQVDTLCLDTPEFMAAIRKVLVPVLDAGADRIVIGCTHYSFLGPQISRIIAGRAELVDVASAIAEQCVRLAGDAAQGSARLELLATARPERLQAALAAFGLTPLLQRQTEPPRQVDI